MDLGIQHSLGSAAIHNLEDICDRRCVKCLRRGDNPDEDVGLEYLDQLVREVSIGVNQVEFNLENLAVLTGNTFTRPQDWIPLSSMGFVGPLPLATPMLIAKRDGQCAPLDITLWSKGSEVVTTDATSSLRESLDQGIPLPPLPRYPEWYLPRAPPSPSPTSSHWGRGVTYPVGTM